MSVSNQIRFLAVVLFVATECFAAPIQFEDTSDKLGFTRGTETWGIAWGNLDTDKYPDLWNSGHRDFPRIYKNNGAGDFDDVAMLYDRNQNGHWISNTQRDVHGGAWGDIDNDGDDDFLAGDDGALFTNNATTGGFFTVSFVDNLIQNGVLNNTDSDRELESDLSCNIIPPNSGLTRTGQYILLFDIDVDGQMDELCVGEGPFPYQSTTITSGIYDIPPLNLVNDTAIGDFNNDLRSDLVMTRGFTRPNGASKVNDNRIEGWFRGGGRGFTFSAIGEVTFLLDGVNGGAFKDEDVRVLNSNGTTVASGRGFNISYDSVAQLWRVEHNISDQAYVRVIAENVVSDPELFGLTNPDLPQSTALGINRASGMEWVNGVGLSEPKSCVSIVAADFDNDMDLDIYMACRNGVSNLANRYYDNQGDGTFEEVVGHGGEGPIGAGIEFGLSDSVITADYDLDGFMDLAVSNGLLFYPVSLGGPDTLIRNQGNSNHWIELDLIGTVSPRAAIGAKVFVTAGGRTQLREQSAGYHRWSQNHSRIHFGLAGNTTVDEIRVEWPSGAVNTFNNVSADQLYDVVENGSIVPATLTQPSSVAVEPDEECGQPAYTSTLGPALLVWRDCGTDNWRIRARGGLGRLTENRDLTVSGTLVGTDRNFGPVGGVAIGSGDFINDSDRRVIDFSLTVQQQKVNSKGLNFNTNEQSGTCLALDYASTDFEVVYLGNTGKRIDLPYDLSTLQSCIMDRDGDGIDDASDPDDDNDGVLDVNDAFPFDPTESADSDNDGVGDNADVFPNDASETADSDGDGIGDNSDIDNDNDGLTNAGEQATVPVNFNAVGTSSAFGAQDASSDFTISQDGSEITLRNNTWRKTNRTYTITPNTVIEFDFRSDNEGEVQGIGFSSGSSINGNEYFVLSGTQTFGIRDFVYAAQNQTQHFVINVGGFYTGTNLNLVLINDDDVGVGSDSRYSNLLIYENLPGVDDSDNDNDGVINQRDLDSDNDGIADIVEVGLLDQNNDFLVDDLLNGQGIVALPRDSDGDSIPDFLDLESNNAANDGTAYDISGTLNTTFDTNNDGTISAADNGGGIDNDSDGIDDLIDTDPFTPGNGQAPVADDSCGAPSFDRATEQGLFLWRDCPSNSWNVRLTAGGISGTNAIGRVDSEDGFTDVTEFSFEANDVLDAVTNPDRLEFELRVGGAGQDGIGFVPLSDNACFIVDSNAAFLLGENKVPTTSPLNLTTLGSCDLPVDPPQCGEPAFDRTTEPGAFLWQDCSVSGVNDSWFLRITGGGLPFDAYVGTLTSTNLVTVEGTQLEANDVIDGDLTDNGLDFRLNVANSAVDGLNIQIPSGGQTCFNIEQLPSLSNVYVGRLRSPMNSAFNLENLGVCQ